MHELGRLLDPKVLGTLGIGPELLGIFAATCLVVALGMRALPDKARKPFLLLVSLAFGARFLDPLIAAFVLGTTLALWAIVRLSPPGRARLGAAAALLVLVYLPFCFSGIPQQRIFAHPGTFAGSLVLLVVFFKRAVYFLYELHHRRFERPGPVDFFTYFLSLPFLLGQAPVVAYTHFHGRYAAPSARGMLKGLWTLVLVLLHLALLAVLTQRFVDIPMNAHLAQVAARLPWLELALILGLNYVAFYLFRYAHDQLGVASARMLGFAIDDNYANPLAATDYADFWRRWNIHLRQMLVSMFYYPVVLRLSRAQPKRRALNVLAACTVVFFFHGLFMLLSMGTFVEPGRPGAWGELAVSLLIYEALQIVLTAGSLLLLGRAHRTGRWKWIGVPLGIGVNFTLRSLMLLLIWRRGMSLTGAWWVLLALMP